MVTCYLCDKESLSCTKVASLENENKARFTCDACNEKLDEINADINKKAISWMKVVATVERVFGESKTVESVIDIIEKSFKDLLYWKTKITPEETKIRAKYFDQVIEIVNKYKGHLGSVDAMLDEIDKAFDKSKRVTGEEVEILDDELKWKYVGIMHDVIDFTCNEKEENGKGIDGEPVFHGEDVMVMEVIMKKVHHDGELDGIVPDAIWIELDYASMLFSVDSIDRLDMATMDQLMTLLDNFSIENMHVIVMEEE